MDRGYGFITPDEGDKDIFFHSAELQSIDFDDLKHTCQWGNIPSDKIVLQVKYSLFEMEGNISFPNLGKTIGISFKGGLKEKLPKLK